MKLVGLKFQKNRAAELGGGFDTQRKLIFDTHGTVITQWYFEVFTVSDIEMNLSRSSRGVRRSS